MQANSEAMAKPERFLFASGWLERFIVRFGTIAGVGVVVLVFSLLTPSFFTLANARNILLQSMPLLMLSLAMTIVLIMRAVDLSIAYNADFSALVVVWLLLRGHSVPTALAGGLAVGAFIGLVNGFMVTNGVSALVATLGMMFILRSAQLLTTGGGTPLMLMTLPKSKTRPFLFLGQGNVGGVPMQVVIGLAILLLVYVLVYQTRFGRYMHAIGGNVLVAYLSGIRTKLYMALGFVLGGFLSACGGIMSATRTGMAQPEGSSYLLLDSFVAAYIGSITFFKGKMNILGTVVGVFFVSILSNGVTVLGLGVVYQYLFKGCLIFLAVALAKAGTRRE